MATTKSEKPSESAVDDLSLSKPDEGTVILAVDPAAEVKTDLQEFEESTKRPSLDKLVALRYAGSSQTDERIVTVENLTDRGVKVPDGLQDIVLNKSNDFQVPIGDLNAAVVDFLIQFEDFEVV
jgi:hypothetical protein